VMTNMEIDMSIYDKFEQDMETDMDMHVGRVVGLTVKTPQAPCWHGRIIFLAVLGPGTGGAVLDEWPHARVEAR
jgi:hypothetical protein